VIQELRGNVRVFARIRPFLPDDKASDDQQPAIHFKSEASLRLVRLNYINQLPLAIVVHDLTTLIRLKTKDE
jgi:hypothetical protein